ncbi:hypothetical protein HDU67_009251 [Dinochytrium kinnereticum]|nr:hypothetical protein HDU67_009251 [Dinochytrium kinnereticum]
MDPRGLTVAAKALIRSPRTATSPTKSKNYARPSKISPVKPPGKKGRLRYSDSIEDVLNHIDADDEDYGASSSKKRKKLNGGSRPAKRVKTEAMAILVEEGAAVAAETSQLKLEPVGVKSHCMKKGRPINPHLRDKYSGMTKSMPEDKSLAPPADSRYHIQARSCLNSLYRAFPRCFSCAARLTSRDCAFINFRCLASDESGSLLDYEPYFLWGLTAPAPSKKISRKSLIPISEVAAEDDDFQSSPKLPVRRPQTPQRPTSADPEQVAKLMAHLGSGTESPLTVFGSEDCSSSADEEEDAFDNRFQRPFSDPQHIEQVIKPFDEKEAVVESRFEKTIIVKQEERVVGVPSPVDSGFEFDRPMS